MKGRGKKSKPASSPFFSGKSVGVRPSLTLFLFLGLALFMTTAKRYDWYISLGVWAITGVISYLVSASLLNPLKKMVIALPFVVITILIHAFFTPGTLLVHYGTLMITREGLEHGLWVSHKIAFLFWVSFVVSGCVPEAALLRWMGAISRLPGFNRRPVRLWMITLFLLLRWLVLLPVSWKAQLAETLKGLNGKREKMIRGVEALPGILKRDILALDAWIDLLVLRGYAEGVLWIADNRARPWRPADWFLLAGVIALWTGWGFYME